MNVSVRNPLTQVSRNVKCSSNEENSRLNLITERNETMDARSNKGATEIQAVTTARGNQM